jgi:DNA-binding beta-propeller fold protein YncE
VVAIDMTNPTSPTPHWRTQVKGVRADHAAMSKDGKTLLVSASTAKRVHVIDTQTGAIVNHFASGDEPHESNFSHDGTKIFHASIGRVFLATTSQALDPFKGDRWFEIVDAKTFKVLDRFDMREKTKEFGQEWKDAAVRPMAISPDDKRIYFQMSFLHGYYVFDVDNKQVVDMKTMPDSGGEIDKLEPQQFQLNSADHGLTIDGEGKKLCVAGTIKGEAYVVDIEPFRVKAIDLHDSTGTPPKPYWATTSADGESCYVSISGLDEVVIISFRTSEIVGRVKVGRHPQRVRTGSMLVSALAAGATR